MENKLFEKLDNLNILGDINQSIENEATLSIYDDIKNILDKKKITTISMSKSFRYSYK